MNPIRKEVTIGNCRLLLGDCLEILPTLGKVDHVISDPPYEDELHKAMGRIRRNDGRVMVDDLGFEGVNTDRASIVKEIVAVSSGWAILFTLAEGVRAWRDELQACAAKYDTCIAWIKPDSTPRMNGQGPARGFECAVTAWCGTGYRKWNSGGKRGVYTYLTNNRERDGRHPTEKPIGLMSEILADFTALGQLVCDPFMGSGTTGISCARLGRRFVGIERDETHFETACERIQDAVDRPDLFIAPREPEPKQVALFGEGKAA